MMIIIIMTCRKVRERFCGDSRRDNAPTTREQSEPADLLFGLFIFTVVFVYLLLAYIVCFSCVLV